MSMRKAETVTNEVISAAAEVVVEAETGEAEEAATYAADTYSAEIDAPDDTTSCECSDCGWTGNFVELRPIGDCCLTPGDGSPAGRCPECDALAYVDTVKSRAHENGERLHALLKTLLRLLRDKSVGAKLEAAIGRCQKLVDEIDGSNDGTIETKG